MSVDPIIPIAVDSSVTRVIKVDGSAIVLKNLSSYAKYVIEHMLPDRIDGLKKGNRRGLFVLNAITNMRDRTTQSVSAVGDVSKYHPHGDASIYDALVRMAQPFHFNPPLVNLEGNVGSYTGDNPASARYTELGLKDFALDLFFKGIDIEAIPARTAVDLKSREPSYLIPAIPTTLLHGANAIGYGVGAKTPSRNLADICDLTIAFCKHKEKNGVKPFNMKAHADKLLPDFPINNVLLDAPGLLEAYRHGDFNAPIAIEGTVTLEHGAIIVHSLPYGKAFDVERKIQDAIRAKEKIAGGWFEKNLKDVFNFGGIKITLQRGVNVFDAWERVKPYIKFYDAMHPRPNYTDEDGYLYTFDPRTLLELWYKERSDLVAATKRRTIRELYKRLRIVQAYLIVCRSTNEVIQIIKDNDASNAAKALSERFAELTQFQADHLASARLTLLSRNSEADLKAEEESLKTKITATAASLESIASEIAQTAADLKKKYPVERMTRIPNYIGYVSVDHGCIQFEHVDEITEILGRFPKSVVSVHMYDGPNIIQVDKNGKALKGAIPKYTTGDIYGLLFDGPSGYTVNFNDDGTACCIKGIVYGTRAQGFCYTTPKSIAINKDGSVETINVPEAISLRKTVSKGARTNIIHVYPYTDKSHFVVVMNDKEPNTFIVQRVSHERGKIILPRVGENRIVHHYTGKNWYFTADEKFLNRINGRVFHIPDAEALLGNKNSIRIDVASAQWKRSKLFKILV